MTQQPIVKRVYAAKGDSMAADAIIRDYLPFIKAETSKAIGRIITNDKSDEVSIAMIAFHEAIQSYQRLRGAFLKYAAVVIHNRLIDYYRKEKRHIGQVSLYSKTGEEDEGELLDTLPDSTDAYQVSDTRQATVQEINELKAQLEAFGLTLNDIADNCPQQERTFVSCQKALAFARETPNIIEELKRTKKLPLVALVEGSKVERKTLERHRKYLMALMIIYSNGYEIIRGHLRQVQRVQVSEVRA